MVAPLQRFHLLSSLAFGLTAAHPAPCLGTEKPRCVLEPGLGTGYVVAGCSWLDPEGRPPRPLSALGCYVFFFIFAHP